MRTLLVTLEYKPFEGGVAKYYSELFSNWPDDEIFVLTQKMGDVQDESKRIIRGKLISPIFSWLSTFWVLYMTVKKTRTEHIIVGQILPIGTVVWLLSFFMSFDYSVILHGMDYTFSQKKPRKMFLAKKILLKSTKIICGNSYLEKLVKKDLPNFSDKIFTVNPGVSPREDFYKKATKNNSEFSLVFLGRLVKRKGVDRVIKTIELLDKNKYANIKFYIAGTGPDEDYLKNISKDSRIIFLGKIDDKKKSQLMAEADVFIMPTREIDGDFEGFGIVYLEANIEGIPVIATDSGGVADAVSNMENGILLENDNPEKIKDAIIKLYENPELRKKIGERGRERALEKFSWSGQINKINKIIKNDINNNSNF